MKNLSISFKPVLLKGLKWGIIYSSIFALVTTGCFTVIIAVSSNESTCQVLYNNSALNYYGCILQTIFFAVPLSLLAFIFVGFPVMIFPVALGSSLLSFWLFSDFRSNRLSLRKSRLRETLLGVLSGFAPGSIFFFGNSFHSSPLTLFNSNDLFGLMWGAGLFVLPPIFGGLAGFMLSSRLIRELNKSVASIKPRDEYFQIDWGKLQKEAQQDKEQLDT